MSGLFLMLPAQHREAPSASCCCGHGRTLLILTAAARRPRPSPADPRGEGLHAPPADPVAQALILTAIVLSFAVVAFAVVLPSSRSSDDGQRRHRLSRIDLAHEGAPRPTRPRPPGHGGPLAPLLPARGEAARARARRERPSAHRRCSPCSAPCTGEGSGRPGSGLARGVTASPSWSTSSGADESCSRASSRSLTSIYSLSDIDRGRRAHGFSPAHARAPSWGRTGSSSPATSSICTSGSR